MKLATLEAANRRADRADRRAGRAARSRARVRGRRSLRPRAASGWPRCSATGSTSSCSATGGRSRSRSSRRCSISPIAQGLPLVATNEPFFARREDFEAHDALLCIAEGRGRRRVRPAAADARASLQDARRDGGAVRRSAGGARLDRRDRAALPFRPLTRKPILPRFTARGRHRGGRGRRAAPPGGGGADAAHRGASGSRRATPSTTTASGSTSSSASSSG